MTTQLTSNGIIFSDNTTQITKTTRQGKNRIINGAMEVDQRTNGAASAVNTISTEYISVDRFASFGSIAGKFSLQQNMGPVTPPSGFVKYLGFKSATAYTLLAADGFIIGQLIEGVNIADLLWGTTNAKAITVSFWVRSSLTGTFSGSIRNNALTHSYNFTYSIPTANIWIRIEITIPGCTAGVWNIDNTIGFRFWFNMGVGNTNSTSNPNIWEAANKYGVVGSVSLVSTLNATFYVTGIQLEQGSVATEFEKTTYDTELLKCQRYYQIGYGNTRGYCGVNLVLTTPIHYYTIMRTSPTAVITSSSNHPNVTAVSVPLDATRAAHRVQNNATAGDIYALVSRCTFSAEL